MCRFSPINFIVQTSLTSSSSLFFVFLKKKKKKRKKKKRRENQLLPLDAYLPEKRNINFYIFLDRVRFCIFVRNTGKCTFYFLLKTSILNNIWLLVNNQHLGAFFFSL
ncbi:hypothetical protein CsSME_00054063 [Camellia sinensis var. sinensis]